MGSDLTISNSVMLREGGASSTSRQKRSTETSRCTGSSAFADDDTGNCIDRTKTLETDV